MTATEYLKPVQDAATLLEIRFREVDVENLAAIIDKLGRFPRDIITPFNALARLQNNYATVEELDILQRVLPEGQARYELTATTLTWKWSAKHTGQYATITVPFPALLPLTFTVDRFCDMDNLDNHSDECPQRYDEDDEEYSSDCECSNWIEQTATLTVEDWNDDIEAKVNDWLARAVTDTVKDKTLRAKKTTKRVKR